MTGDSLIEGIEKEERGKGSDNCRISGAAPTAFKPEFVVVDDGSVDDRVRSLSFVVVTTLAGMEVVLTPAIAAADDGVIINDDCRRGAEIDDDDRIRAQLNRPPAGAPGAGLAGGIVPDTKLAKNDGVT